MSIFIGAKIAAGGIRSYPVTIGHYTDDTITIAEANEEAKRIGRNYCGGLPFSVIIESNCVGGEDL